MIRVDKQSFPLQKLRIWILVRECFKLAKAVGFSFYLVSLLLSTSQSRLPLESFEIKAF